MASTVGSAASDGATLDLDDLMLERGWGAVRAYSRGKLAMMMDGFEWARRLAGTGVVAHVVHPGGVRTNIATAAFEHARSQGGSPDAGGPHARPHLVAGPRSAAGFSPDEEGGGPWRCIAAVQHHPASVAGLRMTHAQTVDRGVLHHRRR